jgi:hypothetical protein
MVVLSDAVYLGSDWSVANRNEFLLRVIAFACASTSVLALLARMYGLVAMSFFIYFIFLPATFLLTVTSVKARRMGYSLFWDRLVTGIWTGSAAYVAYNLYRIPFVLAGQPLFKVFPVYGLLVTGVPSDSIVSQIVGLAYGFSNGVTFGIMFVMVVGGGWWFYAVIWGLILESAMVASPYPVYFGIPITLAFITISLTAHVVFGTTMGLLVRKYIARTPAEIARNVSSFKNQLGRGKISRPGANRFLGGLKFRDRQGRRWVVDLELNWYCQDGT